MGDIDIWPFDGMRMAGRDPFVVDAVAEIGLVVGVDCTPLTPFTASKPVPVDVGRWRGEFVHCICRIAAAFKLVLELRASADMYGIRCN